MLKQLTRWTPILMQFLLRKSLILLHLIILLHLHLHVDVHITIRYLVLSSHCLFISLVAVSQPVVEVVSKLFQYVHVVVSIL